MAKQFRTATAVLRAAFLSVFERKDWEDPDKEPKFEATLIAEKRKDLQSVEKALNDCIRDTYQGRKPGPNFQYPVKPGHSYVDADGNIYDGFENEGSFAFKATSQFDVKIVDQRKKEIPFDQSDRLKSGDYVACVVEAQCWRHAGKEGASLYLKVIQLVRTGEELDSGGDVGLDLLSEYEADTIDADFGGAPEWTDSSDETLPEWAADDVPF